MSMRLTGSGTLAEPPTAAPPQRPSAPWQVRAVAAVRPALRRALATAGPLIERAATTLAPARQWLAGEIAKSATLARALAAIRGSWTALVEAFCATIDPYLARAFPDLRLVATVAPSGAVELNRATANEVSFLGLPDALDGTARAALSTARWTAVELRLRPEHVLHRTLALPAASRDFLDSIIAHKLERLTPWRPEKVLYGYQVTEGETGSLSIALSATSRDLAAPALATLAGLGLAPTAIGVDAGPLGTPLRLNLLRDPAKAAGVDSRRFVSRFALVLLACLAMVWLATSLRASSADDAAQLAGTRLMKARRLLKAASMGDVGERERAMLEEKRPERATVVMIDKLAGAIPADTYLKELSIGADKLRLVGITQNAPALIGELETTGLRNVRFTAAVTREKDGKDTFEVSADRALPPPADAP